MYMLSKLNECSLSKFALKLQLLSAGFLGPTQSIYELKLLVLDPFFVSSVEKKTNKTNKTITVYV